jgi:hypothetical protein
VVQAQQELASSIDSSETDGAHSPVTILGYMERPMRSGSGRMTSIIGPKQEWLVVATDANRTINPVGFDASHSPRKSLAIVSAGTISQTEVGTEIISRPHQSVSNPFTSTNSRGRKSSFLVDARPKQGRWNILYPMFFV